MRAHEAPDVDTDEAPSDLDILAELTWFAAHEHVTFNEACELLSAGALRFVTDADGELIIARASLH